MSVPTANLSLYQKGLLEVTVGSNLSTRTVGGPGVRLRKRDHRERLDRRCRVKCPTPSDVDDDMVLEAAVNGRADAIVTFNLRDFIGPAEQFGIEVARPGDAVQRLEETP
jgi:PIN domain